MDPQTIKYPELCQALFDKASEFAEHLKTLTKVNDELKSKCEKTLVALTTIVGTTTQIVCSVCFTRERSHVCVPCGHAFCESCSQRAFRRGRCHTCRGTVESQLRVFL